ncbi:carbamoyltransferase HypF [Campylobacter curvus]|uniref:carbamoyltransferase HypF n=1 Tax=Campylobacter curvus TaxID=200 RepID=UPI0014701054|nr:carbamoyltransferase HypF [Campylobacter curvus]
MKSSYRYEISGLVQGVGFRPFVYNLALRFGLFGEVYNDDEGVKLCLFGKISDIAKFEKALFDELPELARIDELKRFDSKLEFSDFKIISSKSAKKQAPILPDFALCADCEREFYDPANPRYHYAFINCTNCGPRFSIIKSLPYDRPNTTMSKFKMCGFCEGEYKDPSNRRYHAQPVSCPNCGPTLMLKDKTGKILSKGDEAAKQAARLINEGKILAVKGLGGFHLVCDAHDENAVNLLRKRKNRPSKPFAIMSKNLQSAQNLAQISDAQAKLLNSNLKPIVLLQSAKNSPLAPSIAPNLNKVGVMLAFSGIHLLLFEYLNHDIVATSANVSGEVVIYDEKQLQGKLGGVFDYYLDHDREIYSPSDDSIAFVADDEPIFIRTSRGLNPKFFRSKFSQKGTFLALGAELKDQFAIYKDGEVMMSPYIGDLKNIAVFERFEAILKLFASTYELKFDAIIADMHPHFLNVKWAKERGFTPVCVQHHYAHLLSVMFENDLPRERKFLGFCFDGTGYAPSGEIWGGEVMIADARGFERIYHFDEFALIGGESSIKNIWQIAYSLILKYGLEVQAENFLKSHDKKSLNNLKIIAQKGINSPQTSSLGRIFDAFASIVLSMSESSYEGESGMRLEALYNENLDVSYKFSLQDGVINFKEAMKGALKDEPRLAATAFINALANIVCEIAKERNLPVLLSGGVFQNATLLRKIVRNFRRDGVEFYLNKNFCSNDSGVSLGQMYYYLCSF